MPRSAALLTTLLAALLTACHHHPQANRSVPFAAEEWYQSGLVGIKVRASAEFTRQHTVHVYVAMWGTGNGHLGRIGLGIATQGFTYTGADGVSLSVPPGEYEGTNFELTPTADGPGWIAVTLKLLDGDHTTRWFHPLLVTPGEIRECRPGEAACQGLRDPGPQAP
jgi:hypothetical protein